MDVGGGGVKDVCGSVTVKVRTLPHVTVKVRSSASCQIFALRIHFTHLNMCTSAEPHIRVILLALPTYNNTQNACRAGSMRMHMSLE